MTPDEEIKRAEYASRLLMEPLFQEVMDEMEQQVIDGWKNSKFDTVGSDFREECYRMHRAIGMLRDKLKSIVDNGMIAQNKLEKVTHG